MSQRLTLGRLRYTESGRPSRISVIALIFSIVLMLARISTDHTEVFPQSSAGHFFDASLGNSISFRQHFSGDYAGLVLLHDFNHIGLGEFSICWNSTVWPFKDSFSDGVSGVVHGASKKEMVRIAAKLNVAFVAYKHSRWDGPFCEYPCQSVSQFPSSAWTGEPHHSITAVYCFSAKNPTFIRTGAVYAGEESGQEWRLSYPNPPCKSTTGCWRNVLDLGFNSKVHSCNFAKLSTQGQA